jgi:hypothetical protein
MPAGYERKRLPPGGALNKARGSGGRAEVEKVRAGNTRRLLGRAERLWPRQDRGPGPAPPAPPTAGWGAPAGRRSTGNSRARTEKPVGVADPRQAWSNPAPGRGNACSRRDRLGGPGSARPGAQPACSTTPAAGPTAARPGPAASDSKGPTCQGVRRIPPASPPAGRSRRDGHLSVTTRVDGRLTWRIRPCAGSPTSCRPSR